MRNSESTVNNLSYLTRFSCELAPVVEGLTKVVSMESSRPCAVPGTDFAAGNRGGGIIAVVLLSFNKPKGESNQVYDGRKWKPLEGNGRQHARYLEVA